MVEAALGNARHAFDAAGDEGLAGADGDLAGGVVDGGHGGTAEAVHGYAAEFGGEAGQQADETGNVRALLGFRIGDAENDVFQRLRVDAGAFDQTLDGDGCEVVRPYADE